MNQGSRSSDRLLFSFTPETGEVDGGLDVAAKLTISDTEILLTASMEGEVESYGSDMEMNYSVTAKVTKETTDDKITIKGEVDAAFEQDYGYVENKEEMDDLLTLSVTYKKDGDLRIKAKVDSGSSYRNPTEVFLKGNLKTDDGKVTFEVDSVAVPGFEISKLGVTLILDPNATMPEIPADAIDLLTMDEDDLMDLAEEIEDSKLGSMFFGSHRDEEGFVGFSGTYRCSNNFYYTFYAGGSYEYWNSENWEYTCGEYRYHEDRLTLTDSYGYTQEFGFNKGYSIYTNDYTYYFVDESGEETAIETDEWWPEYDYN